MAYKNKADQAAAQRRHYERNKEARKARSVIEKRERNALLRGIANLIKRATPCADCGLNYPAECMDFDHVRGSKDRAVALLINCAVSVERLFAEIAKCEVVCSNCHRLRTGARRPCRA